MKTISNVVKHFPQEAKIDLLFLWTGSVYTVPLGDSLLEHIYKPKDSYNTSNTLLFQTYYVLGPIPKYN